MFSLVIADPVGLLLLARKPPPKRGLKLVRISVWGATAGTLGQMRTDRFAGKTASCDDL